MIILALFLSIQDIECLLFCYYILFSYAANKCCVSTPEYTITINSRCRQAHDEQADAMIYLGARRHPRKTSHASTSRQSAIKHTRPVNSTQGKTRGMKAIGSKLAMTEKVTGNGGDAFYVSKYHMHAQMSLRRERTGDWEDPAKTAEYMAPSHPPIPPSFHPLLELSHQRMMTPFLRPPRPRAAVPQKTVSHAVDATENVKRTTPRHVKASTTKKHYQVPYVFDQTDRHHHEEYRSSQRYASIKHGAERTGYWLVEE